MHSSWKSILYSELEKPYFQHLVKAVIGDRQRGQVYPSRGKVFSAFEETPFDSIKVVILGQDPYHGKGQAHGLAFSVLPGVRPPPSLQNIYRELRDDLGATPVPHGYLMGWAHQGVFLLNTVLTVREGEPGSHRNIGWETFTDHVISEIVKRKESIVFLLWGRDAQSKAGLIDTSRHVVLATTHPSPMSARFGFLGSRPFSKANEALKERGIGPVNWQLPKDPYDGEETICLDTLLSSVDEY